MKESKFSLKVVLGVVGACILMALFYISVLGENDKSKNVVENFMIDIKEKNYVAVELAYSTKSKKKFKSFEELMESHFMIELSLLEHFDLTNSRDYAVKVKRDNTWFPIFSKNNLNLSISIKSKDERIIIPSFNKAKPLKGLVTVTREKGFWKIKEVNIGRSELANSFDRIKSNIQVEKYVQITKDGFVLNQSRILTDKITPLERKVIIHNFETALEKLRNN